MCRGGLSIYKNTMSSCVYEYFGCVLFCPYCGLIDLIMASAEVCYCVSLIAKLKNALFFYVLGVAIFEAAIIYYLFQRRTNQHQPEEEPQVGFQGPAASHMTCDISGTCLAHHGCYLTIIALYHNNMHRAFCIATFFQVNDAAADVWIAIPEPAAPPPVVAPQPAAPATALPVAAPAAAPAAALPVPPPPQPTVAPPAPPAGFHVAATGKKFHMNSRCRGLSQADRRYMRFLTPCDICTP